MSSDKESFHNHKNSILHNVSVIEDVQLNIEHDTKPVTIVLTMFAHGGIQKLRLQDEVGRWFLKCQLYLISLLSKHVNRR